MYKRNNARTTYKSNRRPSFKKTGGYQNYKSRNRGNITQQYNKYLKLAKESFRSGDRVQSEYYYQFTDHYFRLMVELGINLEENVNTEDLKQSATEEPSSEDLDSNIVSQEKTNEGSIESIPFIAGEPKDKS